MTAERIPLRRSRKIDGVTTRSLHGQEGDTALWWNDGGPDPVPGGPL